MRKFKDFITEEILPFAQTEKGFVGIDNGPVRDNINLLLAGVTAGPHATPYHALESVRRVLMSFHIALPATSFLDGETGHEAFKIDQFGKKMGVLPTGDVVTQTPSAYSVYFEYEMNDYGSYDVFCEVVDEEELQDILDDIEDEGEDELEEDYDHKAKADHDETKNIASGATRKSDKKRWKAFVKHDNDRAVTGMEGRKEGKKLDEMDSMPPGAMSADHAERINKARDAENKAYKAKKKADSKKKSDEGRAKRKAEPYLPFGKNALKHYKDKKLTEVSKNTLKSYIKKASGDLKKNSMEVGVGSELGKYADGPHKHYDDALRRSRNRVSGISKAADKLHEVSHELAKRAEKKSFKDYYNKYDDETSARKDLQKLKTPEAREKSVKAGEAREKAAKRTMKFQQYADKKKPVKEETINELSKKTLRSYINKADKQVDPENKKGLWGVKNFSGKNANKISNRQHGIEKASDRLAGKMKMTKKYLAKEETKQLEFRPTSIPDKDQGPFTKNLKIIKKSDCAKEKLDEVSAELAQRASDKADQKASKLASKHMNWSKTSNKDKKYRRGIAKQETKAIKQHLKFSDYAAKKSMKEAKDDEPPFDNPTEKPSTPYKNSASKAKQLARAAMKKAMADKK